MLGFALFAILAMLGLAAQGNVGVMLRSTDNRRADRCRRPAGGRARTNSMNGWTRLALLLCATTTMSVRVVSVANANTVLDFEAPLPNGLIRVSPAGQGTPVPVEGWITGQYANVGVVMEGVALVDLMSANPSGVNSIGGVNSNNTVDYGEPMTFRFVTPGGGEQANTDYFAITTDTAGYSGNIVRVTAFDADDNLVGSVAYTENDSNGHRIILEGIGAFHRVVVDPTLFDAESGGIGFDLVEFGALTAVPENRGFVPSNLAILRCEEGLLRATTNLSIAIYTCHRRLVRAAAKRQTFDEEACEQVARSKYGQGTARLFAGETCPPCAVTNAQGIAEGIEATLDRDNGQLYCEGVVPLP